MATTETGTVFDSLSTYAPGTGGGLAGDAARQNIAAAPDIARLSQLINQINHAANQGRVTGGAELERLSSENIANNLMGNLPQSFVQSLQTGVAQRGATGGFGVDSPNMNAAALRGMGLQSMQLQAQGQQDLNSAYQRAAPLFQAENAMVTPGLLETQQNNAAQRALQAQQIADNAAQWRAQLAQRDTEFKGTIAQQQADLAARMGLSYAQMGEQARQFDVGENNQTTRLGLELAARSAEQQANNAIQWAKMQMEQSQFGQTYGLQSAAQAEAQRQYNASLANQQNQFRTTSAQNQAQLYAQTYGALPGYNEYGMYTGQNFVTPKSSTSTAPTSAAASTGAGNTTLQDLIQQIAQGKTRDAWWDDKTGRGAGVMMV